MTRRILIGVTIDDSLQFHTGLPERLVEDGWDVHVVSGPGRRNRALGELPGVTAHVIPMERSPSPIRDLVALARWRRLLRAVRPDAMLVGTPKAALLAHVAGRRIVPHRIYNLLGLRVETATGMLRRVLLAMERLTARSATRVLAVSRSVESEAIELGIVDPGRVLVLGRGSCNGVDTERHASMAADRSRLDRLAGEIGVVPGVPVIGFVGRLTRDKGLPELADALEQLHADGIDVQLLVLGEMDDDTGRLAMERLHATGQRVLSVGYQDDPAEFYGIMDVFCLPSLREGLPNVVLEAMASRTVVVATAVTGNVDLVRDGDTGYLADRSGSSLAEALRRALAEDTGPIVERAAAFVHEHYRTETVQRLLRDYLLSRLASGRGDAPST